MPLAIFAQANIPADPYWVWIVVKAGAACTGIAAVYKYAIKPVRKKFKGWGAELTEFRKKIDYITAELRPNGGNSMRDQVDYIRKLVEKVHQRQLNFFQFKPYGIIEFDTQGKCVWVNRGYLDIVQRHPEEILGHGWRNIFPEDIREQVVREWISAVNDGRDFMIKTEIEDKEGHRVPVDIRRLAMHADSGELLGYLGFMCHAGALVGGAGWPDVTGTGTGVKCMDCPVRFAPKEDEPPRLDHKHPSQ